MEGGREGGREAWREGGRRDSFCLEAFLTTQAGVPPLEARLALSLAFADKSSSILKNPKPNNWSEASNPGSSNLCLAGGCQHEAT